MDLFAFEQNYDNLDHTIINFLLKMTETKNIDAQLAALQTLSWTVAFKKLADSYLIQQTLEQSNQKRENTASCPNCQYPIAS